tara:strand:+ start:467 stop:979 length:513 start_codon:yes stop_codon:yes gene_type:complete
MIKLKDLIKEWNDTSFRGAPKRWSKKVFDGTTGLTEFEELELGKLYTDKDRPPFKVNEENPVSESTEAYGKSLEKIANDKKLKMISKKDRDTLKKLANLMKEENLEEVFKPTVTLAKYTGGGNYKPFSQKHFKTEDEAKKYVKDMIKKYKLRRGKGYWYNDKGIELVTNF